jgi:hypothetical protein
MENRNESISKKITVAPADKMTERQIAAKVRQFFSEA